MVRRSSKTVKLVWRVGEKPTGRYRSFHKRSWPSATYAGTEEFAGFMVAVDGRGYTAREAETTELRVYVAVRPPGYKGFSKPLDGAASDGRESSQSPAARLDRKAPSPRIASVDARKLTH